MEQSPLKLLSLDGGGVRGYAELIILEAIMKRVQDRLCLQDTPLPADYFDMIGGTSTGGLIAIMLGRLRMSVEECQAAYEMLTREFFEKQLPFHGFGRQGRFSAEDFVRIIRAQVRQKLGDSEARLRSENNHSCKVFVCTVCTDDVKNIRLLRSYQSKDNQEYDCAIWEAARATAAAPTYYASVQIGPTRRKENFIDGALGCNNPIYKLHDEAERCFDSLRKVACVVSLGTGKRRTTQILPADRLVDKLTWNARRLMKSLKELAVDSEKSAEDMKRKYIGTDGLYYRFNVERGLEDVELADWDKLAKLRAITLGYIADPDIRLELDKVADALVGAPTAKKAYSLGMLSSSNQVVMDTVEKGSSDEKPPEYHRSYLEEYFTKLGGLPSSSLLNHYLAQQFVDAEANYESCSWFFQRQEFQDFHGSPNTSVLWVKGAPGFGKSVLAATTVHHLYQTEPAVVRILYHFCSREPSCTTLREVMCSFLAQISQWNDDEALKILRAFHTKYTDLSEPVEGLDEGLINVFRDILMSLSGKIFIVVDGIDSCISSPPLSVILYQSIEHNSPSEQESAPGNFGEKKRKRDHQYEYEVDDSSSSASNERDDQEKQVDLRQGAHLKLFLTSRHEIVEIVRISQRVQQSRTDSPRIQQLTMTAENTGNDLRMFVQRYVNGSASPTALLPQGHRNDIINTVCQRAHGMLLYAALVLEQLDGDKIASKAAIRSTLKDLPQSIYKTYESYIQAAASKRNGAEVFWWIYSATRLLSWNELQNGLAMVDGEYDDDEWIEQDKYTFIYQVCGPLVEFCGERNMFLRFIHPTVKELLDEKTGPGAFIKIQLAHATVASKLLSVLGFPDVPNLAYESASEVRILKYQTIRGKELFSYAVLNWFKHLRAFSQVGIESVVLEKSLVRFLASDHSLKWLVAALVLTKSAGREGADTLAQEVTDCLWTWLHSRGPPVDSSVRQEVENWCSDFLVLMTDWQNVLWEQPRFVYSLHIDLLPKQNRFRKLIAAQSHQSVVRFSDAVLQTRSSRPPLWMNHIVSIDAERDLAYVCYQGYLQCYHIVTKLLVAEMWIGHSVCDQAVISPDKTMLALSFVTVIPRAEETTPSTEITREMSDARRAMRYLSIHVHSAFASSDSAAKENSLDGNESHFSKIRRGYQICSPGDGDVLARLCLENQDDDNETNSLSYIFDVPILKYVVCLVQLNPLRQSREGLFSLIPGMTQCELLNYTKPAVWKIDDPKMLAFSPDSQFLLTPQGSFRFNSEGQILWKRWKLAPNTFNGAKVTVDFTTLAVFFTRTCVALLELETLAVKREIQIQGIGHILAISDHGRFLLILKVSNHRKTTASSTNTGMGKTRLRSQRGTICVYDKSDDSWIDLLILLPPKSKDIDSWAFQDAPCQPSFTPDSSDTSKVVIYVPQYWSTTNNIRFSSGLPNPRMISDGSHLLVFEGQQQRAGFGREPILRHIIPIPIKVDELQENPSFPRLLNWNANLDEVTVTVDGRLERIELNDLQRKIANFQARDSSIRQSGNLMDTMGILASCLLLSPELNILYRVQLIESSGRTTDIKRGQDTLSILDLTIRIEMVDECDVQPAYVEIQEARSSISVKFLQSGQTISIANSGLLMIGTLALLTQATERRLKAIPIVPQVNIYERALSAFACCVQPFGPRSSSQLLQIFDSTSPRVRYSIFLEEKVTFSGLKEKWQVTPGQRNVEDGFVPIITQAPRNGLYVCQYSRIFDVGEVIDGVIREATSFELFCCIYDSEKDKVPWMVHTTTGGTIHGSQEGVPRVAWALHPTEPLLIWAAPGHRVKLSHFNTGRPPVNIAEPLDFEVDSSEGIRFSPNGRYVLFRAHETCCNFFYARKPDASHHTVIVLDLQTGLRTKLTLCSPSNISADLDNDYIKLYRLTRGDAIEMTVLKLPEMVETTRFNLTHLPADCSCPMCGETFQQKCDIFVQHFDNSIAVVISHGPVHKGYGPITDRTCEPIILRTSIPREPLIIEPNDTMIKKRSVTFCPRLIDREGKLCHFCLNEWDKKDEYQKKVLLTNDRRLKDTAKRSRTRTELEDLIRRELDIPASELFSVHDEEHVDPSFRKPFKAIKSKLLLDSALGKNVFSVRIQPILHLENYRNIDTGQTFTSDRLEAMTGDLELRATESLRFGVGVDNFNEKLFYLMKKFGLCSDLPDTWEEVVELMNVIDEDIGIQSVIDPIFPPGETTIGTKISLLVHTFHFGSDYKPTGQSSFDWTSAMDYGWIEQDIGSVYRSWFLDDIRSLRSWYNFRDLDQAATSSTRLLSSEDASGRFFRQALLEYDVNGKLNDGLTQDELSKLEAERSQPRQMPASTRPWWAGEDVDYDDIMQASKEWDTGLENMSRISPVAAEFFKLRLNAMLHQSFLREI